MIIGLFWDIVSELGASVAHAVLLDGDTVHASVALAVSCSVSGLLEEYTSTARQRIQCFRQFPAGDPGF